MHDSTPELSAPNDACDCHMHVVYPTSKWPVAPGEMPFPQASISQYQNMAKRLGIERCIVNQTPRYHLDNRCVLDAIKELGDGARGTAAVDANTPKQELTRLTNAGIRGAALHMVSGRFLQWEDVPAIANNVASEGWHLHIQLDGVELATHLEMLKALPNTLIIDHIGKFSAPSGTDSPGFRALLNLVNTDRCYVKLSAPYESAWGEAPYMEHSGGLAAALIKEAPERVMWGSNWPHLGVSENADKPDDAMLLDTLLHWTSSSEIRNKILRDNPARIYGF